MTLCYIYIYTYTRMYNFSIFVCILEGLWLSWGEFLAVSDSELQDVVIFSLPGWSPPLADARALTTDTWSWKHCLRSSSRDLWGDALEGIRWDETYEDCFRKGSVGWWFSIWCSRKKSHVHGTEINKQTMREIAFFFQQSFWGCDVEPIAAG